MHAGAAWIRTACLTLIHLVSIPITDTSVNPARSIGPALFAGLAALGQLWLFIVAPFAGGALVAGIYSVLRAVEPDAQLSTRKATQSLPTEQEQRLVFATEAMVPPSEQRPWAPGISLGMPPSDGCTIQASTPRGRIAPDLK